MQPQLRVRGGRVAVVVVAMAAVVVMGVVLTRGN